MEIHTGLVADNDLLSLEQLSEMLSVSDKVVIEWIEHDVIYAVERQNQYYISCDQLAKVKAALRLARDLGVNAPGIAIIYQLRQRVKELEALLEFE
ncbi:chaperone modulator CbpM [Thiotrichales bacterium 19S3-7]|nr:chaperone modulator CbpM [Thiotrichales bacterium 19S3-7]MCF6803007.1 chaperone modulator CbpM [Thiotrichales bacterium 19S3-11]